MKYTLKIKNKWMEKIKDGTKKFEYRLADKGFMDITELELIDEDGNSHTYKAKWYETVKLEFAMEHYHVEIVYALCNYYKYEDLDKYGVACIEIKEEIKN